MKKITLLILCVLGIILTSCNNRSKEDIEKELSSGVVLIQNSSYYEIVLGNGERLYFSSYSKKDGISGLTFNRDSVEVSHSYGTGFLISDDGKMVTNAHVVSNMVSDNDVNMSVTHILDMVKSSVEVLYEERTAQIAKISRMVQMAYFDNSISAEDFYRLRNLREALIDDKNDLARRYVAIDLLDTRHTVIKYHNSIGVAFDNTFITNNSDYAPCVIRQKDMEHDLAVIQLKSKKSPEGRYIFNIGKDDPLETYSVMDKFTKSVDEDKNGMLYMISFNLGPSLAITKEGIKHQFNIGSISQKTDERILYSIPTLPGSSGSPVVNQKGELVAINYAGLTGTQSFNYGIRVKFLKQLLDGNIHE